MNDLRVGGAAHLTSVTTLITSHMLLATGVYPNLNRVGGAGQLKTVLGALMTIVLIVAVLMTVVCAATWAVASAHGNYQTATKARTGLLVAEQLVADHHKTIQIPTDVRHAMLGDAR